MKVLFICRHNVYRSKVAEALFNKLAPPGNEAKSAGAKCGVTPARGIDWYDSIVAAAKRFDLYFEPDYQLVNQELLDWADKVIIVADDIEPIPDAIVWQVHDIKGCDVDKRAETIKEIETKVKELIASSATK